MIILRKGFFRVEPTVNRRVVIVFDEKIKPQLNAEASGSNERSQTKTNRTLNERFFPRFERVTRNCDWFITLFVPVVIGRNNYFASMGFSTVI